MLPPTKYYQRYQRDIGGFRVRSSQGCVTCCREHINNDLLLLSAGSDLPVQYLRLLAPPLQLLSAAVWQVVQQGLVDHYGILEEFVTMVTELVPELMSYSQKAQLIMGLRARVSNSHGFRASAGAEIQRR